VRDPDISRIHAPIGLNIGAVSPAEIAVAIMAQITESLRREPQLDQLLVEAVS
jgi:xanthine dehydrogenase accessory factor